MKATKHKGAPIDVARMRGWMDDFAGYRVNVTEGRIDRWIKQFGRNNSDLAARILDAVDFVSRARVAMAMRQALVQIPGWNINPKKRKGKWIFVPFTASAGESGDTMLHEFRIANGMGNRKYEKLFKYKSDLPREALGPKDTVIFVDDFAGTGEQAIDHWERVLSELLPQRPNIYLVLVVASVDARKRINKCTDMVALANAEIRNNDNIFDNSCRRFSVKDKATLLRFCKKAKPEEPQGFGKSGLLLVFAHRCPNNTIPVLHESNAHWEGLFRRND